MNWTRWSRRNENRIFGACGSYGEMAWLWGICHGYGRMAGLWGSAKTYGEIRQACGCMGAPRKRMGNATGYGNLRRHMGGRQAVWGAKNHIKTGTIGTVGGLRTLQILMKFWWELRFSGRPLKCMGILKNMVTKNAPDVACRLCENQEPPACMGKPRYNMGTWTACGNARYM